MAHFSHIVGIAFIIAGGLGLLACGSIRNRKLPFYEIVWATGLANLWLGMFIFRMDFHSARKLAVIGCFIALAQFRAWRIIKDGMSDMATPL